VNEAISKVQTDLDRFDGAEVQMLQNHGYVLAEEAACRHLPDVSPFAGGRRAAALRAIWMTSRRGDSPPRQ
jgi:hypothetical protein